MKPSRWHWSVGYNGITVGPEGGASLGWAVESDTWWIGPFIVARWRVTPPDQEWVVTSVDENRTHWWFNR